jgi:activating signal cointegrator complex subunit 3
VTLGVDRANLDPHYSDDADDADAADVDSAAAFNAALNDDADDVYLSLSRERLEAFVRVLGSAPEAQMRTICRLASALMSWHNKRRRRALRTVGAAGAPPDLGSSSSSNSVASEFGADSVTLDLQAFLDDRPLPTAISKASMFSARKVDASRTPTVVVLPSAAAPGVAAAPMTIAERKKAAAELARKDAEFAKALVSAEQQAALSSMARADALDKDWLLVQSKRFVQSTNSTLDAHDVARSILATLKSNASTEQLQIPLFELLGPESFDLISVLLEKRFAIVESLMEKKTVEIGGAKTGGAGGGGKGRPTPSAPTLGGGAIVIQSSEEIELARLKAKEAKERSKKSAANRKPNKKQEQRERLAAIFGDDGTGGGAPKSKVVTQQLPAEWFDVNGQIDHEKLLAMQQKRNEALKVEAAAPLMIAPAVDRSHERGLGGGAGIALPEGHTWDRSRKTHEEVFIPAKSSGGPDGEARVPISEFPPWARKCFAGIAQLNRLQSRLYESAFLSGENLLVAAPTGAGKTNVALMTVLREIGRHLIDDDTVDRDSFKIIYIAPMKALAAEMVRSFQKRLAPLGVRVAELTGDMQLTRAEIAETQMIVTTPEKWDVITRKSSDDALTSLVRLLIIDEVHLLHEERGAVLEVLVSRTLRQVESSQSLIRIVGLSATLPNYRDVARFLRVRGGDGGGLYFFDDTFRPVPLEQRYIGARGANAAALRKQQEELCYEKLVASVRAGHQCMVFVHSRKNTGRLAEVLLELAEKKSEASLFARPGVAPGAPLHRSEVSKVKSAQLRGLLPRGFGIHNAGLLRPDRRVVETLFENGHLSVLVSTATLAWGVNLPAHTVIICGTQLYDASQGRFVELGMLDVQQIFGRAGRPQFDTSGEGIIITAHENLTHYLRLMTHQLPIESRFVEHLEDHLNAEVVLGTVTDADEAVRWLSYTYLHTRMLANPLMYGVTHNECALDPELFEKRRALIEAAAARLDECRMVRFDRRTGALAPTDLGRAASHFYLRYETIDAFNAGLGQRGAPGTLALDVDQGANNTRNMSEEQLAALIEQRRKALAERVLDDGSPAPPSLNDSGILALVCGAGEFEHVKLRDDEVDELDRLYEKTCTVRLRGDRHSPGGKVGTLLQAHIARAKLESFSLTSDANYVEQNAARIVRGLFEIVLKRRWARLASRLLDWCLMIDKQLWDTQHPLRQLDGALHGDILARLEQRQLTLDDLVEMREGEISELCSRPAAGAAVKQALRYFPHIDIAATVQPITRTVLRVSLRIEPQFAWSDRHCGASLSWHVWVCDAESELILHAEQFQLTRGTLRNEHVLTFSIPVREPLPPHYIVHAMSERFLGCETTTTISFRTLSLPAHEQQHTELLDLRPLPVAACNDAAFEAQLRYTHFNPIQTQIFHTLVHSDRHVLLGAPTGSGKTVAAELAMLRVWRERPKGKCVYIGPLKALVRERINDWQRKFVRGMGKRLVELTGDVTPDTRALAQADILCTTPEKWDGVSRDWRQRPFVADVALLILDEVHLLGEERGPVLEVIVSRMRYIGEQTGKQIRIVALSTALANAGDVADWLGVETADAAAARGAGGVGLFNFRPSVRPVPLEVHIQGYPGAHYCPRMATMNKPTYQAIQMHSPNKPALVFVASRRQTRLTALALIQLCAGSDTPRQFVNMDDGELERVCERVRDPHLRHTLTFGVAMHHAGLHEADRSVVEALFEAGKVQVLVSTATLAWGVNLPAHLVVIKGTEFFDGKTKRYVDFPLTDVLQMMGRAGRPQFDTSGKAVIMVAQDKKNFYKKFLYESFPVESSLAGVLTDHLNAEIVSGTIASRQDALDYLTWTYYFRRLLRNPSYYGVPDAGGGDAAAQRELVTQHLCELIDGCLDELETSGCVRLGAPDDAADGDNGDGGDDDDDDDDLVAPLALGHVASYYYLSHRTVRLFSDELAASTDVGGVLQLLSDAAEFDEMPVRHNEEEQTELLAKQCRFKVPPGMWDDPHIKTAILLQLHVARAPLPISDFATDQRSALAQAIRVLQAMIDVAASDGYLQTTLNCAAVVQMLKQARWADECPLGTLDAALTPAVCARLRALRVAVPEQAAPVPVSLPALVHAAPAERERALRAAGLGQSAVARALAALRCLPKVQVQFHLSAELDDSAAPATAFAAGSGVAVHVKLRRANGAVDKSAGGAFAPHFPKASPEALWLIVGDSDAGELVALRRARADERDSGAVVLFDVPDAPGRYVRQLYVISDSYIGLDQQYALEFEVK